MQKRLLALFSVISLISSIFFVPVKSAAIHPNWQIIEDYESADSTVYGNIAAIGGSCSQSFVSNPDAISGNKSLKTTTDLSGGAWSADAIVKTPISPTISNPSGYFFRMETNAPKNASLYPMYDEIDWATNFYSNDTIFVSDDGTVTRTQSQVPKDNFSGYVFVNISGMNASKVKKISLLLCPWQVPNTPWEQSTLILDNVGYFSVTNTANDTEYSDIVASLNVKWQVIEDYEAADSTVFGNLATYLGTISQTIISGTDAIYGDKSLQTSTDLPADTWSADAIVKTPISPTIISPTGYFFRFETNAPKNASLYPMYDEIDWNTTSYSNDTIFVSDDGTVTRTQSLMPQDNFSGYVFVNISGMNASKVKKISLLLCPWQEPKTPWEKSKLNIDNVGYFSVANLAADTEYSDIVASLNSKYSSKPSVIQSISVGNVNNDVMFNSNTQIQVTGEHLIGKTVLWSVDDTNIATIDNYGKLTTKQLGTVKVTASIEGINNSAKTISINIVKYSSLLSPWQVIEDYEAANSTVFGNLATYLGTVSQTIISGTDATYGDKSLQTSTDLPADTWSADTIVKTPISPTISNPSGYFFRLETNAPKNATLNPMYDEIDWTTTFYSNDTIFVSDDGTVTRTQSLMPQDNFSGYVFVNISGMNASKVKKISLLLSPFNEPKTPWGKSKLNIDNVGYFSVSNLAADTEYSNIVASLNSVYLSKPSVIQSISIGNANNEALLNFKAQMQVIGEHLIGKTILWSVDDTNIATIDNYGKLTTKQVGTVIVTASIKGIDNSAKTISINIVNYSSLLSPWQIIEDYETANNTVFGNFAAIEGTCSQSIVSGKKAVSGNKSLNIDTNLLNGAWSADAIVKTPAKPTLSKPSGYFFRLETNAPKNASIYPMFNSINWDSAFYGSETIFVEDNGTVTHTQRVMPKDNFSGYVFVYLPNMDVNTVKTMGLLLSPWEKPSTPWGKSKLIIDNVGYFRVENNTDNSEYANIVASLNTQYSVNLKALKNPATSDNNMSCYILLMLTSILVMYVLLNNKFRNKVGG